MVPRPAIVSADATTASTTAPTPGHKVRRFNVATIKKMLRSFHLTAPRKKTSKPAEIPQLQQGNAQLEEENLQPKEQNPQPEGASPQPETTTQSEECTQLELPRARLLSLPRELRTMIFESAITAPGVIEINKDLKPPALVQVNRQIRAEAYKLWYLSNQFRFAIRACDTRLYCKFRHWHRRISPATTAGPSFQRANLVLADHVFHWANLVEWRRSDYDDRVLTRSTVAYHISDSTVWKFAKVLSAAMLLVAKAKSWNEVERGLKALRLVAGALDAQRLEDR